jgi:ATP-binding cassette subfamily B protein
MSDPDLTTETDIKYPFVYVIRRVGRPHLPWFVAAVGLSVIAAIGGNFGAFLIGVGFDTVFNNQPLTVPLVPDALIPETNTGQLWFISIVLFVNGTFVTLGAIGKSWLWEIFGQRVLDDIRVETFDSAQRQELAFFDRFQTGDVMNALNDDVNRLEHSLSKGVQWTIGSVVKIGSALAFMAYLNWQLTLVVFLMVPAIAAVDYWFSIVLEKFYDTIRRTAGKLNGRMESSLGGINVVKANVAEPFERDRFTSASDAFRNAQWDGTRIRIRQEPTAKSISGVTLIVTMLIGGIWVIDGPPLFFTATLTAGQLIPFLFYMRNLEGPIEFTTAIVGMYKMAKASSKRIVGVRNADTRVEDDSGAKPLGQIDGDIHYDDVSFSYPDTDERVIDGITFTVDAGETVGIVGSTGAGKSTLIKLLLRFYQPDGGTIRIDGQDIGTITRQSLRNVIGYVDQDPFLFNGTIRENIQYGTDDANHEDVVTAAKEAGAHEFITQLPEGYDTPVGQRGVKLSGGQRQRIAIARAVVDDPPVLVFDEATSHVDNETEMRIQQNLEALTADRTTFVIAHRLSTVRNADDVLVMDDGRLAERGKHDTLLDADGVYANLWYVQVGEIDALPARFIERVTVDNGG